MINLEQRINEMMIEFREACEKHIKTSDNPTVELYAELGRLVYALEKGIKLDGIKELYEAEKAVVIEYLDKL